MYFFVGFGSGIRLLAVLGVLLLSVVESVVEFP